LARAAGAVGTYAEQKIGIGMYPNAIYRAISGETLGGKYQTKGLIDSMAIEDDPERSKIIAESLAKFGLDVFGGQLGTTAQRVYDYQQKKEYRDKQLRAGAYINSTSPADIAGGTAALIRTYRVTKGDMERMTKARLKDSYKTVKEAKNLENEGVRVRAVNKAIGIVANARTVSGNWFSDREIAAMVQDAGFSESERRAIMKGNTDSLRPYVKEERKTKLERIRSGGGGSTTPGLDLSELTIDL
jgi:hypothetical protein